MKYHFLKKERKNEQKCFVKRVKILNLGMGEEKTYNFEDQDLNRVSEPAILYAVRNNRVNSEFLIKLKELSQLKESMLSKALN